MGSAILAPGTLCPYRTVQPRCSLILTLACSSQSSPSTKPLQAAYSKPPPEVWSSTKQGYEDLTLKYWPKNHHLVVALWVDLNFSCAFIFYILLVSFSSGGGYLTQSTHCSSPAWLCTILYHSPFCRNRDVRSVIHPTCVNSYCRVNGNTLQKCISF